MEQKRGIDSFTLHILAMLFMLCDHLWAALFPAQEWLTCIFLFYLLFGNGVFGN